MRGFFIERNVNLPGEIQKGCIINMHNANMRILKSIQLSLATEQFQRRMQILSLSICIFILLDGYLIPFNSSKEVVTDHIKRAHPVGSGKIFYYKLITAKRKLNVAGETYSAVKLQDTVIINQSMITRSIQQIVLEKDRNVYVWHVGFLSYDGVAYVVLLMMGIVFFLIFYKKMDHPKGRQSVGYYLLFLSMSMLLLHIFL
jgi:ABC-type multidrug transport system permease subunit